MSSNTKKKVMLVFGTRPEAIKMCPLYLELKARKDMDTLCLITAQHRDMLDSVMRTFGMQADYDLNIMSGQQTLTSITSTILEKLNPVLQQEKPDLVLVHGDTTTAFAAALACTYEKIPVGHVEAGMRSFNRYSPFPEEMNRRMIACMAMLNFAATVSAKNNLLAEGIPSDSVVITGNTVIDALRIAAQKEETPFEGDLSGIDFEKHRVILLTCHRRENWGAPMADIFAAVKRCLAAYPDVEFIFPIHKNPLVREAFAKADIRSERMHTIEPLDYLPFVHLMKKCALILTDSGGVQEEAPYFGVPVVVIREVTERMEAVNAGTVILAGTKEADVYRAISTLLDDPARYQQMSRAMNPYGDGNACARIADSIAFSFGLSPTPPKEFEGRY